jgi:hypothetical protein
MKKMAAVLILILTSGLTFSRAEKIENLKVPLQDITFLKLPDMRDPAAGLGADYSPLPAAVPDPHAQAAAGGEPEDARVLNYFSQSQWDELFSGYPESGTGGPPALFNRELFSDFNTRYLVEGFISFKTTPPQLTTDSGKVFMIERYPAWLKQAGDTRICVEGYAKQQDDTSKFIIKKILPLGRLDSVTPKEAMLAIQKTAYVIPGRSGQYALGNIGWNLKHAADGTRAKDQYGNLITEWRTGVVIKPELLETAYFVKKSGRKAPKYGKHGLLMFKFKPGGVIAADGKQSFGLAISLNAYYKDQADMSYSQIDGLRGKYMVYYSISTMEKYTEASLTTDNLYFYPLAISRRQQLELLDNAIGKATENKIGEMYSLFYNSCTNAAISLINSVLEQDQKIVAGWLPEIAYRTRATFPDTGAALLLKRGIVKQPLQAP